MPEFQVTGSVHDIETPADLFEVLTELVPMGWRGTVSVGAEAPGEGAPDQVWTLDVRIADPTAPTGVREMKATLGDMKVVVGSTVTVMTAAAYDAAYGTGS